MRDPPCGVAAARHSNAAVRLTYGEHIVYAVAQHTHRGEKLK